MWYYNNKLYDKITDLSLEGFIYLITFKNSKTKEVKKYIGKKNFFAFKNVKKGKRELAAMTDKRGSKKKKIIKESNWKTYKTSQTLLKNEPESNLKKEILYLCHTKTELTYQEVKHQFLYGVLENDYWLNKNILGRLFNSK
jgi:hypothetical protein